MVGKEETPGAWRKREVRGKRRRKEAGGHRRSILVRGRLCVGEGVEDNEVLVGGREERRRLVIRKRDQVKEER